MKQKKIYGWRLKHSWKNEPKLLAIFNYFGKSIWVDRVIQLDRKQTH